MYCDTLYINAQIISCSDLIDDGYGIIKDAAMAILDNKIIWVDKTSDIPVNIKYKNKIDVQQKLITPGLIDCHTHIVYAGNRSNEFEDRLNGVSYEEIANRGGGILSTVNATREASYEELFNSSKQRVENLISEGVTSLEIKSGYGLNYHNEKKMLSVAKKIGEHFGINIKKTFLGAHALPNEFKGKPDGYITFICKELLPKLHSEGLVDAVDAFCEKIAFSKEQVERVFKVAKSLKIPVKLHAEQLSNQNGSGLVAKYNGLSADHLEYLSEIDIKKMQQSNTVAVLLPGAFYTLRETKLPPIKLLKDYNIPIAISTDCNPGTSPIPSILSVMNMACILFKMPPEQVILGVTKYAAIALGEKYKGSIQKGYDADFVIWDIDRPADLCYSLGNIPKNQVIVSGKLITKL